LRLYQFQPVLEAEQVQEFVRRKELKACELFTFFCEILFYLFAYGFQFGIKSFDYFYFFTVGFGDLDVQVATLSHLEHVDN